MCPAHGKVVVFWQDGFPTIESQPVSKQTLLQALGSEEVVFAGTSDIKKAEALKDADLLVLPYGSAVPADVGQPIREYLAGGGNLLTLGGRPFCVPVTEENGRFVPGRAQNTYSRQIDILHSYEVPQKNWVSFAWDEGFAYPGPTELRAKRVFVTRWDGRELPIAVSDSFSTPTENGSPLRWLKKTTSRRARVI